MRVFVHDYSGHPFQAQLSRELARRGHNVTHSSCVAYVGGKGKLAAEHDDTNLHFATIGHSTSIDKEAMGRRTFQELALGFELAKLARKSRPDVALISTTPIPTLMIFALAALVFRIKWVLWHQDVQAVAIKSFAGDKLPRAFVAAAWLIKVGERWASRRSAAIVVIAESFRDVHRDWGTLDKVTTIPNWAPLDEIKPVPRDNAWSQEQGLSGTATILYSGTLGLKHDPAHLARLADRVAQAGHDVRLVVVNEGPSAAVVQEEAERLGVPLTLLPFQPYERLSEVLGSGDVLVVLLERSAGAFSVPSKTLSYLCAGRPILGVMPPENLASELVNEAGGLVVEPGPEHLDEAAAWINKVLSDPELQGRLGAQSRALAEREFALSGCADKFERILTAVG